MAKKQTTNLPVAYDEELARMAQAYKTSEAASATGAFISVRGGVMQWRGAPVAGNKLDVVILASIFENVYYEGKFDPNTVSSPACYAFAKTQDALKPHELAPNKQGDDNGLCAACWANAWASDPEGRRGKACRNTRRLAVIPAQPLTAEAVKSAEQAYLKLPVTSVAAYSAHVMQLAEVLKRPPFGVVTTISVLPDPKNQFRVTFNAAAEIKDRELLAALLTRAKTAEAQITFSYPEFNEAQPAAKTPRHRVAPPAKRAAPPAAKRAKY